MAKKGGVQQLQVDISTDEDFDKFLDRPGLLVLDVYSEWCGPCLGMVGSLRKIKMEIGGDNLQLATCKADTISYLKRFCKKSEPTWLFVTNGRAIDIMFGTEVPKLMSLIVKQLELLTSKAPRPTYNITELQPIEEEKHRIKTEAIEKALNLEREAKEKKRTDYLREVTDIILENMPDIGITVFGPQVNRDMFKKISEPAETLKMQCKDRKVVTVSKENFETINFACKNPLPTDVMEQLYDKELLVCFWKVDESLGTVPNILMTYAHELTKETIAPADDFNDEERVIPPIITPMIIKVEVAIEDGEEWEDEESDEEKPVTKKSNQSAIGVIENGSHAIIPMDEFDDEEEGEEEEEVIDGADLMLPSPPDMQFDMDLDQDNAEEESEEEEVQEEIPKKLTKTKRVKIPPIWVPMDKRTHATLIYVFFRGQTTGFLPPDPKPEPPHVIMAFDSYKRKDLINVIDRYKDDIPAYGYFTSDDPEEAHLIANSSETYATKPHSPTDKIVLKVNKVQSNIMLSLVSYGPSYVSANVDVGHEDARKFFSENYKSAEQEQAEIVAEAEKPKKSKKGERKSSNEKNIVSNKQEDTVNISTEQEIMNAGTAAGGGGVEPSGEVPLAETNPTEANQSENTPAEAVTAPETTGEPNATTAAPTVDSSTPTEQTVVPETAPEASTPSQQPTPE